MPITLLFALFVICSLKWIQFDVFDVGETNLLLKEIYPIDTCISQFPPLFSYPFPSFFINPNAKSLKFGFQPTTSEVNMTFCYDVNCEISGYFNRQFNHTFIPFGFFSFRFTYITYDPNLAYTQTSTDYIEITEHIYNYNNTCAGDTSFIKKNDQCYWSRLKKSNETKYDYKKYYCGVAHGLSFIAEMRFYDKFCTEFRYTKVLFVQDGECYTDDVSGFQEFFTKKCLTTYPKVDLPMEYKYFNDKIYYTPNCEGMVVAEYIHPLQSCYASGGPRGWDNVGSYTRYSNETFDVQIYYESGNENCEGEAHVLQYSKVNVECGFSHYKDKPEKREFSTQFLGSSNIAVFEVNDCNNITEEEYKAKFLPPFSWTLFFNNDYCIEYNLDILPLENVDHGFNAIKGKCVDGRPVIRNYTYRDAVCEDLYFTVNEPLCIGGNVLFSCISLVCFGKSEFDYDVCSSNGKCVDFDNCRCSWGYYGNECELGFNAELFLIVGSGIIFAILFVVFVFIIVGIFGATIMVVLKQKKKLEKYSEIDVDIILQEREAEKDNSVAHLKINKELFQINYQQVKLLKQIGSGGSNAQVYRALWNERIVAFKVFRTNNVFSGQKEFTEFETEVSIHSSIKSPYILEFYGACLKPPRVGIVMEYASQGSLSSYVKMKTEMGQEIKFSEKVRFLFETAAGLNYLHDREIIHRDVKAENLLLNDNLHIKIIDFGLSKIVSKKDVNIHTKHVGTDVYMSPQMVFGRKYGKATDVYSFGILVFELLTQCFTPYGKNLSGIEMRVAGSNGKLRPVLPRKMKYKKEDWLIELMKECWKHQESDRPTFQEILKVFKKNSEEIKSISNGDVDDKVIVEKNMRLSVGDVGKDGLGDSEVVKLRKRIRELEKELELLKK